MRRCFRGTDIVCGYSRASHIAHASEDIETYTYDTGFFSVRRFLLRDLRPGGENALLAYGALNKHRYEHHRRTDRYMADDIKEEK